MQAMVVPQAHERHEALVPRMTLRTWCDEASDISLTIGGKPMWARSVSVVLLRDGTIASTLEQTLRGAYGVVFSESPAQLDRELGNHLATDMAMLAEVLADHCANDRFMVHVAINAETVCIESVHAADETADEKSIARRLPYGLTGVCS